MILNWLWACLGFISICNSARILAVFPGPFPSHQSVFRPLTQELARRGHELVVITTDPLHTDNPYSTLTEIDVHDVSYNFRNNYTLTYKGQVNDLYDQMHQLLDMFRELFELQMKSSQLQSFISDKKQHFDVILAEAASRPALVFSHLYKAPVITISSLGSYSLYVQYMGVPSHPILYPYCINQNLNNLTLWDKAVEAYKYYYFRKVMDEKEAQENVMLKRTLGSDVPPLSELKNNIAMLMINVHHLWEGNRPVPPNLIYLGGLHLANSKTKKIPTELQSYLDSSSSGVIYMSLGSLIVAKTLENVKIVLRALSKLPYNVLLKWDDDYLPECPSNIKVMKWMPQKEILHHPNIKLFISQGGLQSTDEAIVAGVPLIGIPLLGDQFYNVEKYVQIKIGLRINLESVTEKIMIDAVNTVINNKSYKRNIEEIRKIIFDTPLSSLERAVWWTEYIIRHGFSGRKHLASPAAHLSSWEYYEMNLLLVLISITITFLFLSVYVGLRLYEALRRHIASGELKVHTS